MEPPVLLIDLGNRRLKLAALEAGAASAPESFDLPAHDAGWGAFLQELAGRIQGRRVRLASVNPAALARLRERALGAAASVRVAGEQGWPMEILSRGTGADRILAAWAAWRRCRRALVVADLGTAWTLDLVDGGGRFCGGAIGPGLGIQAEALARACPHLPAADGEDPAAIPSDSRAAVAAGTRVALADALGAGRARMAASLGLPGLRAFLTGGDAQRLRPLLGQDWDHVPDLVLEGLAGWEPAGG